METGKDDLWFSEISSSLQGTAKISLDQVVFHRRQDREFDESNVERLVGIFNKEGCHNSAALHRIPVVVSRNDLHHALVAAQIGIESLKNSPDPPLLVFPTHLQALHGQHRIAAGKRVLAPHRRWWIVDIYLNDISNDLKSTLVEEYTNEKPFSDGHIYYKIRQAAICGDTAAENRWKARLCANSQLRLKYFLATSDLRNALDMVIVIPGNRFGLRISMFHRLQAVKCNEEICHYLKYIYDVWLSFVENRELLSKVSQITVQKLQLLVPSCEPRRLSRLKKEVLTEFSEEKRNQIWNRIQSFDRLIPSLHTFFQDFKSLESCANCLCRLFPSDSTRTVRQSFEFIWTRDHDQKHLIQVSETEFRLSVEGKFDSAYRQMWLFAMRHYQDMPRDARKSESLVKPAHPKPNQVSIFEMANLAYKLGFCSVQVNSILKKSPDRAIAEEALLRARKAGRFSYNVHEFETLIGRIVDCFNAASPVSPNHISNVEIPVMGIKHRCGYPTVDTIESDATQLFLDKIDLNWSTPSLVTSLLVRHSIYIAFFGFLSKECQYNEKDLGTSDNIIRSHEEGGWSEGSIYSQHSTNGSGDHLKDIEMAGSVAENGAEHFNSDSYIATDELWKRVLDQDAHDGINESNNPLTGSFDHDRQNATEEELWQQVLYREAKQEPAKLTGLAKANKRNNKWHGDHPFLNRSNSRSTSSISTTRVAENRSLAMRNLEANRTQNGLVVDDNRDSFFSPLADLMKHFRRTQPSINSSEYRAVQPQYFPNYTASTKPESRASSWETDSLAAEGAISLASEKSFPIRSMFIKILKWEQLDRKEHGKWVELEPYLWDSTRAEQLQQLVEGYKRSGFLVCNGRGRAVTARNCYQAMAIQSVLLLTPQGHVKPGLPQLYSE